MYWYLPILKPRPKPSDIAKRYKTTLFKDLIRKTWTSITITQSWISKMPWSEGSSTVLWIFGVGMGTSKLLPVGKSRKWKCPAMLCEEGGLAWTLMVMTPCLGAGGEERKGKGVSREQCSRRNQLCEQRCESENFLDCSFSKYDLGVSWFVNWWTMCISFMGSCGKEGWCASS